MTKKTLILIAALLVLIAGSIFSAFIDGKQKMQPEPEPEPEPEKEPELEKEPDPPGPPEFKNINHAGDEPTE